MKKGPLQDNWGKQFGFRCWFRRRFQSPATKVPFSESGLREGDFRFAATKVPFSEVGFLRGQKRPPLWDKPQTGEFARRLPGYGESECGRRCGCGFEVSYPGHMQGLGSRHRTSHPKIVQELRRWFDSSHEEVVPGAGAGDVEKMPLGVVDIFQVRVIRDRLDPLLKRNHLIVAGHDSDGAKLQSFR